MPSVQLLNPKSRYIGNDKSHFVLDALQDIYALVIHNIKLCREKQEDKFLTYCVSKAHVGDKVLVRNHTTDVWNLK